MSTHQLLSLGFALACLTAAAALWSMSGRPMVLPHLSPPARPAVAAASAPAPGGGTVAVGAGVFAVPAQRELAGAINNADQRSAAAIEAAGR